MTTLTLNQELNGIEIKFDCKPISSTLESLKKSGFRWHRQKKFWYAKQTPERIKLAQSITDGKEIKTVTTKEKAEKKNVFGVKVGDIFSASWGYEQTNNDFFQVIALVGEKSVRVREVNPPIVRRDPVSGMAEDMIHITPAKAKYHVGNCLKCLLKIKPPITTAKTTTPAISENRLSCLALEDFDSSAVIGTTG